MKHYFVELNIYNNGHHSKVFEMIDTKHPVKSLEDANKYVDDRYKISEDVQRISWEDVQCPCCDFQEECCSRNPHTIEHIFKSSKVTIIPRCKTHGWKFWVEFDAETYMNMKNADYKYPSSYDRRQIKTVYGAVSLALDFAKDSNDDISSIIKLTAMKAAIENERRNNNEIKHA